MVLYRLSLLAIDGDIAQKVNVDTPFIIDIFANTKQAQASKLFSFNYYFSFQ